MGCSGCACGMTGKQGIALWTAIGGSSLVLWTGAINANTSTEPEAAPMTEQASPRPADDVLGYTMLRIDGKPAALESYRGRVLLLVNTASRCGLTPQYAKLEKLYNDHKEDGLTVLGFPANNFMGQEPGSNSEIAAFCTQNYGVTFPMFEKISVKGDAQHPLYKQLSAQPEPIGGDPEWNFTKFLVDRSGRVVARFGPRTAPDDPKLLEKLVELIDQPAPEPAAG